MRHQPYQSRFNANFLDGEEHLDFAPSLFGTRFPDPVRNDLVPSLFSAQFLADESTDADPFEFFRIFDARQQQPERVDHIPFSRFDLATGSAVEDIQMFSAFPGPQWPPFPSYLHARFLSGEFWISTGARYGYLRVNPSRFGSLDIRPHHGGSIRIAPAQ